MRNKIFLIVCLWVLIPFNIVLSQTLHSIIVANTIDTAISSACIFDQQSVLYEIQTIAQVLNYKNNCKTIQDNEFKKNIIEKTVNDLQCDSDDVIFFYYTGIGARAIEDNSKWPQLSININGENNNENYLPLLKIFNLLKKKNPGLLIVIADCDNKANEKLHPNSIDIQTPKVKENVYPIKLSKGETIIENISLLKEIYKNLFMTQKGTILISSSKPGESSVVFKDEGSLFTINYFRALTKTLSGEMECSWDSLLSRSKEMTKSIAQVFNEIQEPQYELNLIKVTDTIPLTSGDLMKIVNGLLDSTKSPSERIKMINIVQEKVFKNRQVMVEIVHIEKINKMNSQSLIETVGFESAYLFLQRLATSNSIIKVSEENSEKDINGKYSKLTILEIIKN